MEGYSSVRRLTNRKVPSVAQEQLDVALAAEAEAHRRLLAGDGAGAREPLLRAAAAYRASWEAAGPEAWGRLIGLLKATVLAGDADEAAAYVRATLPAEPATPPAWYALALVALVEGEDALAARAGEAMAAGGDAFARAGRAIVALARGDRAAYRGAIQAIVDDFAARTDHLTGVAIADTALVLERLAARRGLRSGVASPLLPQ
jgi:hypothetical protein